MGDIADYYRDIEQEWLDNNNYIHPDEAQLHTCADGTIKCINGTHPQYDAMMNDHLLNIIKWIERKAESGVWIETGPVPSDVDTMLEKPVSVYGEEVLRMYNYEVYIKEAKKRKLI